jgi:hypothetical protein
MVCSSLISSDILTLYVLMVSPRCYDIVILVPVYCYCGVTVVSLEFCHGVSMVLVLC